MLAISIETRGREQLQAAFVQLEKTFSNLEPVLEKIGPEFFEQVRHKFEVAGPGWAKLSPTTEARKARLYGGPTQILRATDRLYESFRPAGSESIERVGPLSGEWGSSVPYGVFHDSDEARGRLPRRQIIEVTEENEVRFVHIMVDSLTEQIKSLGFRVV